MPKDRNIILIGHAVAAELKILDTLGFEFAARKVVGVIDIMKLANEILGFRSCSLRDLLKVLRYPFNQLHYGGNDARFTLKAGLLLAVRAVPN